MNGLSAAVVTACAASLIGAVVSGFVTDGGIKKILGLVLGAFTICAMIVPVSRAASIYPEKVEVILAFADESSIIISQVSIYISNSDISQTAKISQLTEQSFQIKPDIIRSEDE